MLPPPPGRSVPGAAAGNDRVSGAVMSGGDLAGTDILQPGAVGLVHDRRRIVGRRLVCLDAGGPGRGGGDNRPAAIAMPAGEEEGENRERGKCQGEGHQDLAARPLPGPSRRLADVAVAGRPAPRHDLEDRALLLLAVAIQPHLVVDDLACPVVVIVAQPETRWVHLPPRDQLHALNTPVGSLACSPRRDYPLSRAKASRRRRCLVVGYSASAILCDAAAR